MLALQRSMHVMTFTLRILVQWHETVIPAIGLASWASCFVFCGLPDGRTRVYCNLSYPVPPCSFPSLAHLVPNPVLPPPSPLPSHPLSLCPVHSLSFSAVDAHAPIRSSVANDALPLSRTRNWMHDVIKQLRVRFYSDQTTTRCTVQNIFRVRVLENRVSVSEVRFC